MIKKKKKKKSSFITLIVSCLYVKLYPLVVFSFILFYFIFIYFFLMNKDKSKKCN